MELLEYQAKELFKMVGIPILPAQTISDSRKIKQLQIPYPVVLKSQVHSGGRGKAGGVRFVANTIDAIAAARTIFNLSILGEYPEVILAEAHYNAEREFFLAIVLDYDLRCPVLLGSAYGGMNVNSLLANLQQVVVDTDFSLFYARRLAAKMGLSGELICSVSEILSKMYDLFQEKDLELIEINPLGVNTKGELMALDGKITIDDRALASQPIIDTFSSTSQLKRNSLDTNNLDNIGWHWLDWYDKGSNIATICNSFDLALLTWDLLNQNQVTLACGIAIDRNFIPSQTDSQFYQEQLKQILTELESVEGIEAILINIWQSDTVSQQIVETLAQYVQSNLESNLRSQQEQINQDDSDEQSNPQPKLILRLPNQDNYERVQDNLKDIDWEKVSDTLYVFSSLETAIQKTIAVVETDSN